MMDGMNVLLRMCQDQHRGSYVCANHHRDTKTHFTWNCSAFWHQSQTDKYAKIFIRIILS